MKNTTEQNRNYQTLWRERHPEQAKATAKAWRTNNSETVNAQHKREYAKLRLRVITHLGEVCAQCGYNDVRALQLDHIAALRGKKRPLATTMLRRILSGEETNIQLLCANCNWIKRLENHEHR